MKNNGILHALNDGLRLVVQGISKHERNEDHQHISTEQTARIFTVPVKVYIEKFHLPEDIDEHSKLKDLRETYGIRPKDIAEVTKGYLQQQNPGRTLEKPASMEGH